MGNRHSPPPPPPPPPPPRRYVNPSNYVREGPYLYATMRNENPGSHSINCLRNTGVFWLPTGGWEISPEDHYAIEATKKHGWGTHVVAYNNGCGRGTATYSHGNRWRCGVLNSYGGFYSVHYCSLDILLRKYDPLPPTPYPIANPTPYPIANPTLQPTLEPTKQPTFEPSEFPTLAPTLSPTKEPTLEPIAHPTQEPTDEPVADPTEEPTSEPLADPTLEPTMEPTVTETAAPTPMESVVEAEGDNWCSFTFVKGTTSEEVPAGCALMASQDINDLDDGDRTAAMFACAKSSAQFKVDNAQLQSVGIAGHVSYIVPGSGAIVKFYENDEFEGRSKVYTEKYHPALVSAVYEFQGEASPEDNCNDNVKSVLVTAPKAKSYSKMPEACEADVAEPTKSPTEGAGEVRRLRQ